MRLEASGVRSDTFKGLLKKCYELEQANKDKE
jgi:hypothetical protein